MKKLTLALLTVFLICCAAIGVCATGGIVEGDMSTVQWMDNATLELTDAGQSTTIEMPAGSWLPQLTISSKLDGQMLYISAHDRVWLMVNGITQQPVDGWYCLDVAALPKHRISITNWNGTAVTLTAKVPSAGPALFDIDVARMLLGNALEFQFGVAQTKIPDKTGYYALIEKINPDGSTTTKQLYADNWGTAGPYWAITYDGLRATEMADTFYVTIYNADGQQVSNAREDSVRAYVARAYDAQKAFGKTMMVDMLNYGAAAQLKFSYNTTDLANNALTAAQLAVGTAATPVMNNNAVKGENYQASRFLLESRIQVQLAFKGLTEDMYAIYTYTDFKGKVQEVRIEGTDFVIIGGKPAGVELTALVYADARSMVEVTVYNADGTVYGTASDSIESCSARSSTGDDVFVALMKFADAAKIYLNN